MISLVPWTPITASTDLFTVSIWNEIAENFNRCCAASSLPGDIYTDLIEAGEDLQHWLLSQDCNQGTIDLGLVIDGGSAWAWGNATVWEPPAPPQLEKRHLVAGDILGSWVIIDFQQAITLWAALLPH